MCAWQRGSEGGPKEMPVATQLAVSVASFAVASCSISTYLRRTLISCVCMGEGRDCVRVCGCEGVSAPVPCCVLLNN